MKKPRRNRTASLRHERELYNSGFELVMGMDEVGRGALAGPVAVGAVCLPVGNAKLTTLLKGVRDSKDMTPKQRSALVDTIKEHAITWGIGSASNREIDGTNIVKATRLAMERALDDAVQRKPGFKPDCFILDSFLWPQKLNYAPQVSLIEGDARSLTIAAGSVIAKVWRDELMVSYSEQFPDYGFAKHKGYGAPTHLAAINQRGPCEIHRMSFKPMREDGETGVSEE